MYLAGILGATVPHNFPKLSRSPFMDSGKLKRERKEQLTCLVVMFPIYKVEMVIVSTS